jgi:hypothetical protein
MPSARLAIVCAIKWSSQLRGPHASGRWQDAVAELLALQAVYADWLEALPDTLQGTATADALQAIVDLDLDTLAAIEPPRGYGRD